MVKSEPKSPEAGDRSVGIIVFLVFNSGFIWVLRRIGFSWNNGVEEFHFHRLISLVIVANFGICLISTIQKAISRSGRSQLVLIVAAITLYSPITTKEPLKTALIQQGWILAILVLSAISYAIYQRIDLERRSNPLLSPMADPEFDTHLG